MTGVRKARFLVVFGAIALLLTTACWGRMYDGSYSDTEAAKERMYSRQASASPKATPSAASKPEAYIAPYEGAQGIHVSAAGRASGVPDLAIISLGVESVEDTASEARAKAAEAMAGVMQVLEDAMVEDRDIQTRYFNISPRYQSVRVTQCQDDDKEDNEIQAEAVLPGEENCTTFWEQKLIGYAVSNQLSVNIRDLDEAGTIIDSVTDAAGDLVRVNGISFAIEDTEPLRDEARAEAMADMQRKAELMADLAGVRLGRLVSLQEDAGFYPPEPVYARAAFAAAESAADTSISAGELETIVSVSGVYLIANTTGR